MRRVRVEEETSLALREVIDGLALAQLDALLIGQQVLDVVLLVCVVAKLDAQRLGGLSLGYGFALHFLGSCSIHKLRDVSLLSRFTAV